jgi:hypothetical protein
VPRIDFAAVALNVLPPGEAGDLGAGRHSVDQIPLERTEFAGGLLPRTMRFANRPTFQQVFTFGAHRAR